MGLPDPSHLEVPILEELRATGEEHPSVLFMRLLPYFPQICEEDLRERVKKSRLRLLEVKTNKEYEAVLNEIEWAEGAISSLEEEILVILEDLDKRRGELEVLKKEVQAEKERLSLSLIHI